MAQLGDSRNQSENLPNQLHKIDSINHALEDGYENMITSFTVVELRKLLRVFGFNHSGDKMCLRSKAIELLHNAPPGIHRTFHYKTYYDQIVQIYRSAKKQSMSMNMEGQQEIVNQHTQYSQQVRQITHITSPQKIPQIQRDIDGNYNINLTAPHTIKPVNEQVGIVQDQMRHNMDLAQINNSAAYSPTVFNARFRSMPFYEVVEEIIKPIVLFEQESCLLSKPKHIMEIQYSFLLTFKQVNYIGASLFNILGDNEDNVYQAQIRIGTIVPGSEELYDLLPLGLSLQIFSNSCTINCSRNNPEPIDCSNLLDLNSNMPNLIKFTWAPDKKTYVWGMYLVKKLSSKFLIQKLKDKEPITFEETKNDIEKILADFDPGLTCIQFSLVCPLGKKKIQIPIKSINCNHLQCFDAITFILMNEKKFTWVCPICSKPCFYEDLRVYSYFVHILTNPNLSESSTEVKIFANGTWRVI